MLPAKEPVDNAPKPASGELQQLDLVSEPEVPSRPTMHSPLPQRSDRQSRMFRFHFNCCQVAAQLAMPQAVLEGRSSIWRVHCPRCGRLSEVPVVD